jgi:hypothetical protein
MLHFARSVGASRTGDTAMARVGIDSLGAISARLSAARDQYWAEQVAIQQLGAQGWLANASGRADSALALLREASRREDATEKSAVTPGPLVPAREQLGDLLLELKRPAEALMEYRATLETEPNRFRALDGARKAAAASGDAATARGYAATLAALTAKGDGRGRPAP